MRGHLLVVSEKKIKLLKTAFVSPQSEVYCSTLCTLRIYTPNIYGFSYHATNTIGGATVKTTFKYTHLITIIIICIKFEGC